MTSVTVETCRGRLKLLLFLFGVCLTLVTVVWGVAHTSGTMASGTSVRLEAHQKHQTEDNERIQRRLDKIDEKLDRLLEKE